MKLFYSPFHTFVHKVLVTAHEAGLWDEIDFIATFPFKNLDGEDQGDKYSLEAINPLDKVPTLALDSGQTIFASQAICEYLDVNGTAAVKLFPANGPDRWDVVSRLALGDTIFESTVQMAMEGWHPEDEQRMGLYEWIWPKIIRGLDALEKRTAKGFKQFDVGQASALHCISYLNFRAKFYEAKDPIYPEFTWQDGRPNLAAWYDEAIERPSVQSHYNKDFEGDVSAERCQRKIKEVLAARAG